MSLAVNAGASTCSILLTREGSSYNLSDLLASGLLARLMAHMIILQFDQVARVAIRPFQV
jgi:hypothetical protein